MKRQREEESSSESEYTSTKTRKTSTSSTVHDSLSKMKIPELKEKLRARGLKVSGKKQELIERLLGSSPQNSSVEEVSDDDSVSNTNFASMKVVELRDACKKRGLKSTGSKGDLIDRLQGGQEGGSSKKASSSDSDNEYSTLKVIELKEKCKERGLKTTGSKSDLIGRLQNPNDWENLTNEGKKDRYEEMSLSQLQKLCNEKGFTSNGKDKDECIDMLMHPKRKANFA
eukprot:TRINITY_DN11674_c0_g1_i1.p1 TRINITY_DN11674_c0_g1~~TRINITY_DN11674_c0_g1_i1.p1  ORF type:complete len:228 (+),score=64.43 TRINITY_DN11674_c0_g1_i1:584-1267(+)